MAVCFGFVTPLFISYVIEARAKMRFARQLRLIRRNDPGCSIAYIDFSSTTTCVLAYINLMLLANIITVAVVLQAYA